MIKKSKGIPFITKENLLEQLSCFTDEIKIIGENGLLTTEYTYIGNKAYIVIKDYEKEDKENE